MKRLSVMVMLLASVALGCKMLGSSSGGGGSAGGSGSASGGSDPKADIVEASRKLIALKSFSAKMEGMGQSEIKQQVDYAAPDRYHVTYLGGTGAGMEIIVIGNQSFNKVGGKWTKLPAMPNGGSMPTLRDSFTEEGLKSLTDAKFEGEEPIDGKPAMVYSYKNVTPKGDYPFGAKMWVSKSTGVPLRVVVDYTNGMLKQMTVNYDTDTPVTIEAPVS